MTVLSKDFFFFLTNYLKTFFLGKDYIRKSNITANFIQFSGLEVEMILICI